MAIAPFRFAAFVPFKIQNVRLIGQPTNQFESSAHHTVGSRIVTNFDWKLIDFDLMKRVISFEERQGGA
jgi:hypothetical protein